MNVKFRKSPDGISCEILDVKSNDFRFEEGFYCYDDEAANDEFKIYFRIKIVDDVFLEGNNISSLKKHAYFRKRKMDIVYYFEYQEGNMVEKVILKVDFIFFKRNRIK